MHQVRGRERERERERKRERESKVLQITMKVYELDGVLWTSLPEHLAVVSEWLPKHLRKSSNTFSIRKINVVCSLKGRKHQMSNKWRFDSDRKYKKMFFNTAYDKRNFMTP